MTERKTIRRQSQKFVWNLYNYFRQESEHGGPLIDVHQAQQRVADALKISRRSVSTIVNRVGECVATGTEVTSPGKKRTRLSSASKDLDNFTVDAIRRVIYDMYAKKKHITLSKLLEVLHNQEIFKYSKESLRKTLKLIGFKYAKDNDRRYLMEQPHIINLRRKFLREFNELKTKDFNFVYIDETWIFSKGGNRRSWQDDNPSSSKQKGGEGTRYVILHAGNKAGFIPDCGLIFSSNRKTGDYHGDMNSEKFEGWLEDTLLPRLEEPSVLIIDNASYHSRRKHLVPNSSWNKQQLIDYLVKLGITVDIGLFKSEILEMAKQNSPKLEYVVDDLVAAHGHRVLRLPPYHCQFNAIEMVWSQCKRYYDAHIGEHGYGHGQVLDMWKQALDAVTVENWHSYVTHTEKIIDESWNQELFLESSDVQELIIHVGDDSSSESEYDIDSD